MSLPNLPYMRPIAKALPVEYESELTYYEYLNNLHYYIEHNLKPYIDDLLPLLDNFPVLKARVDLIQPKVNTLESQVVTLQNEINTLQTTTGNHTTRLNTLDDEVSDLAEGLTDVIADVNAITPLLSNVAERVQYLDNLYVRKTTTFTLGEDAWQLSDIFPSGVKYQDIFGKRIRIVVTCDAGTNISSNATQSLMIGGTYGKTENMSKTSTALTLSASKTYVIDLRLQKDGTDMLAFINPYGDLTTMSWYGGMLRIPNTPFTNSVNGLLTMTGILGTGKVEVMW